MRKVIFRILQISIGIYIFHSCSSIFGPDYLEGGPEFFFMVSFLNDLNNHQGYDSPYSADVIYAGKDSVQYYFFDPALNDTLALRFFGVEETLPLKADSLYRLTYEIIGGWPSTYGLIIRQNNTVLFAGISDWELNKRSTLYDSTGIDVSLHKVLEGRTHTTQTCRKKLTNLELKFTSGKDAIFLHQGEAANLAGWHIYLRVAREVEYMSDCLDDGVNGISYTILRR